MPLIIRFVLVLLFLQFFFASADAQLVLEVTNIVEKKGSIYIGLFDDKDTDAFIEADKQYRVIIQPATKDSMVFYFAQLPPGWYAISIMHDLDNDLKMDKNLIGIPKEPYGFSNNFHPRFSKPDFDDCKFYYNGKYQRLTVDLID